MSYSDQIEKIVIDCILCGSNTNSKLYVHAAALAIGTGEVAQALDELQRKHWIVSEPSRWGFPPKWRVMPIAKAALRRMAAVEAGVEVVEATVSKTGLKAVCRDIGGSYTVVRSEQAVMVFRDKGVK